MLGLLPYRRQTRATAMRHFCRHTDAFTQRWMWMDGLADVDGVSAKLDGQLDLADHVADAEDVRHVGTHLDIDRDEAVPSVSSEATMGNTPPSG